jgi:regulation of enolase protein 1 (concanavalin A-like superfamily)
VEELFVMGDSLVAATLGRGLFKTPIPSGTRQTAAVSFTAAGTSVGEGSGVAVASVSMTTSDGAPLVSAASVSYATVAGSASEGSDYTRTSGTLTFATGTASGTSQTMGVPIVDDAIVEPDESLTVALSNASGASIGSAVFTITIVDNDAAASWVSQDIGAVGQSGSASNAAGTFTVRGAGDDIWGSADAFQFLSQPLSGDGAIVARVTAIQNTNPDAKAGIMIRETLAAGSRHVVLDVEPSGNIEFMTRSATDGATSWIAGASHAPPVWLKLVRTGTSITGWISSDGSGWTQVGATSVTMAGSVSVGLAVTSHNAAVLNTSTFDNVAISGNSGGLPSSWQGQDVGSVGQAGNVSYAAGTYTVRGAGDDIWGSADAFQFVSQPLSGDGAIVARVTAIQNTNPDAKAGIMLRETFAAGSRHVVLDVEPSGNIEFMTRSATDGATSWLAGASHTAPVWLKLVRTGTSITGWISPDGIGWTQVGTTSVAMAGSVSIGLAVTSHNAAVLNTSTFDNVTATNAPVTSSTRGR